jgi:hypothetical protein
MAGFSSGRPTIDGDNLLNAKNAANDLYEQMKGPAADFSAARCSVFTTSSKTS